MCNECTRPPWGAISVEAQTAGFSARAGVGVPALPAVKGAHRHVRLARSVEQF